MAKEKATRPLANAEPEQHQSIVWPALPAREAYEDELAFRSLFPEQILTVEDFWTRKTCKHFVDFLSRLPLVTTPATKKKDEALRVNDRFQVHDPAFAQAIWSSGLDKVCLQGAIDDNACEEGRREQLWGGDVLGLNPNIRIYRYRKGQFFASHYDESNNVDFPISATESIPARTTWTLLIYLTAPETGCIGGETVFYPEPTSKRAPTPPPVVADLQVGTALLHKHGADCMLHEGREVTAGEKWVVRSDLCVRR